MALGFSEEARGDHPSAIIVLIAKEADDHANEQERAQLINSSISKQAGPSVIKHQWRPAA
ncbi:hypothetical protein QA649_34640 [Bradyrhizobium sp. CB1717]|uniref:hypothetical protein n=1 Tax=Bradyrhizobium TaxID=374 RepID=UPI0011AF5547|nr:MULTISPECIES: hypothetical protein [Bradyrhizobium]WFU23178.1 hypothetical protein QA649_34640 [Bradyrhizobium sp. CB1717]